MHIAIAGAGIIGSSIAWRLAQRGCRVTLFDAGVMGGEASWAGAGMLAPGGEVVDHSEWSALAMASAAAYPGFVRELTAESGETIDYRKGGAIEVAVGRGEIDQLSQRVERQATLGIESREIDSPVEGGVARLFPEDAIVDPRHVMRALRVACLARGVTIREHSPVTRVDWRAGQALVSTADGVVVADAAVLAAGAWNSKIVAGFPMPDTFPVRGHLLGYHLPPGTLDSILRRGHTYLLQRSSGFFIVGASSECVGFDRNIDSSIVKELHANAERLFAPLRGLTPEPWIGFRPATATYQPEIRTIEDTGIWLACGHFRNGILLAPETARRVTAGLTGAS